jgi:hypothetical protein
LGSSELELLTMERNMCYWVGASYSLDLRQKVLAASEIDRLPMSPATELSRMKKQSDGEH